MTTYKFRTFQELVDRVPSDRIAECLRECGLAFAQGKAITELVFHTACSLAKDAGKDAPEMPKHLLEVPDELEWSDDGKGEIKTTLSLPDDKAIICKSTTTPQMTDQPTPETDAMFTDNVPDDCQIVAFCERLERERNAARAERDEHIARNNDSLLALHLTTAERDEARTDVARLREVLQRIVSNGGSATNVMLFDARAALAK